MVRCAGCAQQFWPDADASASTTVICPRCDTVHAHPAALPVRPADVYGASEPATWLARHWIDEVPSDATTMLSNITGFAQGTERDFAWCAVNQTPPGHLQQQRYGDRFVRKTYILVAALPASGAPTNGSMVSVGGRVARLTRGGVYVVHRGSLLSSDQVASSHVPELVRWLVASGARPLHALEEVEDPDVLVSRSSVEPASDADASSLESIELCCGNCGAPSRATELASGGTCPYCASPQPLSPDLARTLSRFEERRRLLLAQVVPATAAQHDVFIEGNSVVLSCVRCGSPNTYDPTQDDPRCDACGAGLIPSRTAMQEVLRAPGRDRVVADQSRHRAQLIANSRRYPELVQTGLKSVLLGLLLGGFGMVGGVVAAIQGKLPEALVPMGVGAGMFLAVVIAGLIKGHLQQQQRETYGPHYAALARQLGATSGKQGDFVRWLERWWQDRTRPGWMVPGASQASLTATLAGYPVAVNACPEPSQGSSFAVVLVSAKLDPRSKALARHGEAAALIRGLNELGWHVSLRTGGVALEAGPPLLGRMRERASTLGLVAPTVLRAIRLAQELSPRVTVPAAPGGGATRALRGS